jgi:hypothetical protein
MPGDDDRCSAFGTFAEDVLLGGGAIASLEMRSMAGVHDPVF